MAKFGCAAGFSFAIASGAIASGIDPSVWQTPGSAPATVLSDSALVRLRIILSHYRADRLTAANARALRSELSVAGLERSPALAEEMTRAGFSLKRIEALAGSSKTAPSDSYRDLPSGRKLAPPP